MGSSRKTKHHQVLVEVAAVDQERPRLGAITLESELFVEGDGGRVGGGDGQVDLLHAAAGVVEDVFQDAATNAFAANLRRDIDAPDVAAVARLLAVELPEAGDGDKAIAVEATRDVEGLERLREGFDGRGRLGGEVGAEGIR